MNQTRSWVLALLLAPASAGVAAACSSSSSPAGSGADAGRDATSGDGSRPGDASVDGAGQDGGTEASPDAGADGAEPDGGDAATVEAGPPPVVLVQDAPNAFLVATDGTGVYWVDWLADDAGQQNGRVMVVGVDGGAESTLASTPGILPVSLVLDSANVYWAGSDGLLRQVSKEGGAPLQLATGVGPQTAVQGATVYFCPLGDAGVQAVPVGGGAVVTLTTQGSQADLVVVGGNVYWADTSGHIDYVSATDGGTPSVLVRPDDGGPMEYVSNTLYQNITTDGTNLYWPNGTGGSPGSVFAVALAGGHPLLLDAIGNDAPRSVATDGVFVYFLDVAGATSLVATPVDGGAPHTVTTQSTGSADVSGTPGPTVAVDSNSVYWLDPPRIVKLAK